MSWLDGLDPDHEALLMAIVEALPEPFFLLDRDGCYVAVLGGLENPRYHDGRSLIGKRMHDVLPVEIADRFLRWIREALDRDQMAHHEYELSTDDVDGVDRRDGVADHLWFEGHIAPVSHGDGRPDMVVWMIFNVTDRHLAVRALEDQRTIMERQQAELERLVRIDHLTGLLNRRSFFGEVTRELQWMRRSGGPAAMILFDLDEFKAINDSLGHAAGDAVLRAVSRAVQSEQRGTDAIGRLGGEEFGVLVRGADADDGVRLAERLRTVIEGLVVNHDGAVITVTASFGVSEVRSADDDPDDSIKRADQAMYAVKRRGRNRVLAATDASDAS